MSKSDEWGELASYLKELTQVLNDHMKLVKGARRDAAKLELHLHLLKDKYHQLTIRAPNNNNPYAGLLRNLIDKGEDYVDSFHHRIAAANNNNNPFARMYNHCFTLPKIAEKINSLIQDINHIKKQRPAPDPGPPTSEVLYFFNFIMSCTLDRIKSHFNFILTNLNFLTVF